MDNPTSEEPQVPTPELAIHNADLGLRAAFVRLAGADAWLSEWPAGEKPTAEQEHKRERMRDEIHAAQRAIERARGWAIHAYMRDTPNQGGDVINE